MPISSMLSAIDWKLILPLVLIQLLLLAVALVDCLRAEQTRGAKWMWLLLIVFVQIIGPVLYFVFGKERNA